MVIKLVTLPALNEVGITLLNELYETHKLMKCRNISSRMFYENFIAIWGR